MNGQIYAFWIFFFHSLLGPWTSSMLYYVYSLFFFIAACYSHTPVYHPLSSRWTLGWLHFGSAVNKAIMNIISQALQWPCFCRVHQLGNGWPLGGCASAKRLFWTKAEPRAKFAASARLRQAGMWHRWLVLAVQCFLLFFLYDKMLFIPCAALVPSFLLK